MPKPTTAKQQVIDALLANESITDGLTDADADVMIQWCVTQVERFEPTKAQNLETYGHHLARQARTICRIATHIQDSDERHGIQLRLRQLTDDTAQESAFLRSLDEQRPLCDYIQMLCRIAEGTSYA